MEPSLILTNAADIEPRLVMAEKITILASHAQTGSYEVYVHDAHGGGGPPMHSHPWDEACFVIEGEMTFTCNGETTAVSAGGFVHVPAGTMHTFRYTSPTAKVMGITSTKGAADMFTAVSRECGPKPDMGQLRSLLDVHKVTLAT